MILKLTDAERAQLSALLPEWPTLSERDAIMRRFTFENFAAAFAFMTEVARLAEQRDHHPEWSNIYNKVEIILSTHEAGGLSSRDVELAQFIDRLVS